MKATVVVYGSSTGTCESIAQTIAEKLGVEAIDAAPHALEQRLCREPGGKHWLAHPKAEAFLAGRIALLQRLYKR